jgi:hypothetical protein
MVGLQVLVLAIGVRIPARELPNSIGKARFIVVDKLYKASRMCDTNHLYGIASASMYNTSSVSFGGSSVVEQLAVNQWVVGSSPTRRANKNSLNRRSFFCTITNKFRLINRLSRFVQNPLN